MLWSRKSLLIFEVGGHAYIRPKSGYLRLRLMVNCLNLSMQISGQFISTPLQIWNMLSSRCMFLIFFFFLLWLYSPLSTIGRFLSFLILYTVRKTPWRGNQPVARPLPTYRTTQTENKRTQTSLPRVGFEPTIPAIERAKTVYILDRAATLIGRMFL
jgi:hypothetical protein